MMIPNFGPMDLFEAVQVAVAMIALLFHGRCLALALRERRYQRESGANGIRKLVALHSVFVQTSLLITGIILLCIAVNMAVTPRRIVTLVDPFDEFHLNRLALILLLLVQAMVGFRHIALRSAVTREVLHERGAKTLP